MAYNLALTNSTALATVSDGTVDITSTSLTLVGKNYPGYGTFLNENFVYLLENFANGTAPTSPLPGQLWWDSTTKALKVNTASTPTNTPLWKIISSSTSSTSPPLSPISGDLWWDSGNSQLKVYNGSTWVTIGPAFTASTGQSGAVPSTIAGTDAVQHVIVQFFIANQLVAILSKDATFTPAVAEVAALFPTIKPGFNLSNTANPNLVYYGDSNSALNLNIGGTLVPSSRFLRNDQILAIQQKIYAQDDQGYDLGATGQGSINISGTELRIISNPTGQDTTFYTKPGGVTTKAMTISGTNALVTVRADPVATLGVATKGYVDTANTAMSNSVDYRISVANVGLKSYVDYSVNSTGNLNVAAFLLTATGNIQTGNIIPAANNVSNIGSITRRYSNVHAMQFRGTAITAQYADLAENYVADAVYSPGTVVVFGGEKEVTISTTNHDFRVAGVISTNPAYLMNSETAGATVALVGRTMCQVRGPISKGDLLVSSDEPGVAQKLVTFVPGAIIGKSLETISSSDIVPIEIAVGRF